MKTTVNITATGITIEMDDMLVKIESKKQLSVKNNALKIRNCKKCGKEFTPERFASSQIYCSRECGKQTHRKRSKTDVVKENSDTPFISPITESAEESHINQASNNKFKLINEKNCIICGKPFKPKGPRQERCSEKCGLKQKPERDKINSRLKKKNLDPVEEAELQKTLAEIENAKKKPYQITE